MSKHMKQRRQLPAIESYIGDDIDHINLSNVTKSALGAQLKHSNEKYPFEHNIFGKFNCIEAFWIYIKSVERPESIRNKNKTSRNHLRESLNMRTDVKNFRAIIADANYQRIKAYPNLMEQLKNSVLPFDCYYYKPISRMIDGKKASIPIRTVYANWIIEAFDEIRNALKEDRDPNWTSLLDEPNTDPYQFVGIVLDANA